MKKLLLMKSLLLLCALIVGSSNVWATDYEKLFTIKSSDVVTNSSYTKYETTVSERDFVITFGGNNKSVGTNSGNRSNCKLTNYSKYAVSPVTTSSIASAFACKTSISDVSKISYTISGGSNQTNTNVYLLYSSDNSSFSQVTLTSGTQGAAISSGTAYEFEAKTGYFALLFEATNSSGNWRIDDVDVTFYKEAVSGSDPSISASNVNIAQDATSGSIEYTLNNATGNVSAEVTTGDWLTLGEVTATKVSFTCSVNTSATARTATVTLSHNSVAADKVVTITQAAKTVNTPTYNVQSNGNYLEGTGIVLTSEGNTIYYNMTTDGSTPADPDQKSTEYTGPIALPKGTVKLAAIAYDSYGNKSTISNRTCSGVAPATLPFSWAGGAKSTFSALTGVVGFSLGDYTDNDSNKPYLIQFNGTGDYIEIFTDEKPVKVNIGVKMIGGGSTSKITVQESTNGINFTDVEELTISGSQNDVRNLETSESFTATTRVIKLLFTKGSNVGVGPVSITAANRNITLNDACTDGEMVYGTYSCSKAFVVSDDIEVSEVSVVDGKLFVDSYKTGDVVPANTGVLVAALEGGNYDVALSSEPGTSVLGNDNMLKPSGDAGITAANMTVADTKFYRLTMHNGSEIGFWWGAENGAAFNLAANKAYLAVSNTTTAREGLWFDNDATSLTLVNNEKRIENNEVYDLQGRKVSNPTKGLYIVNGKKVIIK